MGDPHADHVVLTCWPPGLLEQNVSMRRSMGTSASSTSGSTATVAVEVWGRGCPPRSRAPAARGGPLRDRLETIELPGYSEDEKFEIAAPSRSPADGATGNVWTRLAGVRGRQRYGDDPLVSQETRGNHP